jgi:hypothetical protein
MSAAGPRVDVGLGSKRNVIGKIRSPECLDEERTQSGSATFDGARREFAITKQVNLVFADVVWTEAVRRTAEVLRKILDAWM